MRHVAGAVDRDAVPDISSLRRASGSTRVLPGSRKQELLQPSVATRLGRHHTPRSASALTMPSPHRAAYSRVAERASPAVSHCSPAAALTKPSATSGAAVRTPWCPRRSHRMSRRPPCWSVHPAARVCGHRRTCPSCPRYRISSAAVLVTSSPILAACSRDRTSRSCRRHRTAPPAD